jgi:hypothetical protein
MPAQATSNESEAARETSKLLEELAHSREEILRLRDLLIGKDAELGALRGRLAELEGGAAPLVSIAARLRSRIPGPVRSAGAGLRRRRDRQG